VHHVLYTNDVIGFLATTVSALLKLARPERVKAALESILADFDRHVAINRQMFEEAARMKAEESGWEDPPAPKEKN
jgi:hypothetical protein